MDTDAMRHRVEAARVGRLATITSDGRPHVVPCCYALDGDTVYSAVDDKPKASRALTRLANVRAHPVASLLVDHYDEDWTQLWWVRVDGIARIVEAGAAEEARALDQLAVKYPQYRATRPRGPVLAVEISSWRGWPR